MAGGVRIWTEADALFGRIEALAQEIHALIRSGRGNTGDLEPELVELRTLDRALTTLERSFSATFASAARQVEAALMIVTIALGVVLVLVALRAHAAADPQGGRFSRGAAHEPATVRLRRQRHQRRHLGLEPRTARAVLLAAIRVLARLRAGHASRNRRHVPAPDARGRPPRSCSRRCANTSTRGDPFDLEAGCALPAAAIAGSALRGRSVLGERGKPQRMAGSLADVSDRKRAEAQTLQEKERAQVTLASIADAVITVDTAGNVEYMNPVAERLTGYANEEAHGIPLPTVFRVAGRGDRKSGRRSGGPGIRRGNCRRLGRQHRAAEPPRRAGGDRLTRQRRSAIAPDRSAASCSSSTT